jgi:hypothetical protein
MSQDIALLFGTMGLGERFGFSDRFDWGNGNNRNCFQILRFLPNEQFLKGSG